jgi:hypothetical protein
MPQVSRFTRSYNSFSGVDIKAVFAGKAIGTLQGISVSVAREKAPIYTMGSPDARGFARGKRGIAGSLIFVQFDSEPLMFELANVDDETRQLKFLSDVDDLRPEYVGTGADTSINDTTVGPAGTSSNAPGVPVQSQESDISTVGGDQIAAVPWFPDQIPPFDVVLSAANEYGAMAIMKILGLELMNSGYGVSVDDIVSEHSYTLVAHGMLPWKSLGLHPDFDPNKKK